MDDKNNFLGLNSEKTEIMLVRTAHQLLKVEPVTLALDTL